MRPIARLLIVALIVLPLAACGGGPSDSGAQPAATVTEGPSPTPPPTFTPEGTEDPDEGLIFDMLILTRSGGMDDQTMTVTVLGNGALLHDGALLGSIDEQSVLALDDQLDEMGFFRLETRYGPSQARPDTFSYEITARRSGIEATVITVDGFEPESLQRLINDIMALQPVGPAPDPTIDPDLPPPGEGGSS